MFIINCNLQKIIQLVRSLQRQMDAFPLCFFKWFVFHIDTSFGFSLFMIWLFLLNFSLTKCLHTGFVVHRGRIIPTLASMQEPLPTARSRQSKERSSAESKTDDRGKYVDNLLIKVFLSIFFLLFHFGMQLNFLILIFFSTFGSFLEDL